MADGGHFGDREHFWRDHIAGWKSSGLSLRLYSERHGLKAGTLGYWNSRLKARAADAPASSSEPEARATFLAVHVAKPAVPMPEPRDERIELSSAGRMRRSGQPRLRRGDLGPAARRRREAFVIGLPDGVRVYLAAGRTDLRRGIDGLAAQIQTVLREDPFSGHLFVFRGRSAHTIKVLMYDTSGFLLMQKRLTELSHPLIFSYNISIG
jgi:transposase